MRRRHLGWLLGVCICAGLPRPALPQSEPASLAAEEKAACTKNLEQIYKAIEAYELDHKDLPNWLSDLVPKYLPDANVLVCPVTRRTGQTEGPPLADPKLPSSYLFEFCPLPLGNSAPKAPNHTRREWKRRQMGLLGSVVPIVRCRHHNPALNLAFDGKIYESPGMWEQAFTNRVPAVQLTAAHLFANEPAVPSTPAEQTAPPSPRFPARDAKTPGQLLDLTSFYNASLAQTWHGSGANIGNDLRSLPTGLQKLAGVDFDVRGIIQLKSKSSSVTNYPVEVKGIRVRQKCQHLYFLHSAGVGTTADEGKQIGAYVIHYTTNQMQLEFPIVYGRDVRDWHTSSPEAPPQPTLKVAWTGVNTVSKHAGQSIRLFLTTWTNPVPAFEVDRIDFVSSMGGPAPFLIAITAD